MIFFINNKGGYPNFLKVHNDWIMQGLESDMRNTEKSEEFQAYARGAVEANKINEFSNEMGVNAGVDPSASFNDIGDDWSDTRIDINDLVKKLNNIQ